MRALVSARVGLCPFTVDANWYSDDDRVSHSPLDLFALPSLPDRKSLFIIADSFIKNVGHFRLQILHGTDMDIVRWGFRCD